MAHTKQSGGTRSEMDLSISDYVPDALSGRLLSAAISLMGTIVKVQTKENQCYEGVFQAFSPTFEIALEVAHLVESNREDELPRKSKVHDKIIFKLEDIVKMEGAPDLDSVLKSGFATDSEISRANNGSIEPMRQLEPWEPDVGGDEHHLPEENSGPLADGWSVEAMFRMNEKRFLIKSDYDERLYHTAEVNLDPNNEEDQERARRADELAREIERNPASKRAAELENDDEERDIVQRSSGSSANNSAATTPTSITSAGAPNKYIPPNKRTGDRGSRGGRRGGGTGGASFQSSMRNPGSSDVRSRARDFSDSSGGYQLNSSGYFNQRPNRFGHQQHAIGAQTSHERPATGPGPVNEWERPRGSKRQDVRETYGGGPPAILPQMPATGQSNRPLPIMQTRPNVDASPANGNRKVDELRKFSKNFQLAPQDQFSGMTGQSQNSASTNTTGQASRLPPQSSPTQMQLPPPQPPTSIPPPQVNQRRSPDLKNQPAYGMSSHQPGPPPIHHQHHSNQNHPKLPQISPIQAQQPPPLQAPIRTDVPPRMMAASEAFFPQQQAMQPSADYSNPPPVHQQSRPGHAPVMVIPNPQTGNGGLSHGPKMQQIPAHVSQIQPVVLNQPPPPPLSHQLPPVPSGSLQQQLQQSQVELDQRTPDSTNESVKKSKLNPDAAEFRPGQFIRQGSVSAANAPTLAAAGMTNQPVGSYPVPVQSPPTAPIIAQNSMPQVVVYGGIPAGTPVANPALYVGATPPAYQQQQPLSSSAMSVQIVPGSAPVYSFPVQGNQPPAMSIIPTNGGFRPRAGPPQPAVAAATGQPIMAGPYPSTSSYVFYNAAGVQTNQPHPATTLAAGSYQQNAYIMNPPRMIAPQAQAYVIPQASNSNENSQFYTAVPFGPGSYPQAGSVPPTPTLHQPVPGQQFAQQQGNGNGGHSQTPPSSTQQLSSQPANPNSVSGPPPPIASGTGSGNTGAPVMPYPPSAPTPQSPQYPTAPGAAGAYPGSVQLFVVPGANYALATQAAPQLYNNQGGLAAGAVQIHNAAAFHHGYQPGTQPHFGAPEFAHSHYAAMAAAAQQAAFATAQHQISHGYHPTVIRSSSVSGFPPNGGGSGPPGASISHQNNHA